MRLGQEAMGKKGPGIAKLCAVSGPGILPCAAANTPVISVQYPGAGQALNKGVKKEE